MAKELTQDELIAQAVAQMEKKMELKFAQRSKNLISLGVEVVQTECNIGKPKLDKNTGVQVMVNGVPQSYANTYKADLTFKGGSITIDINEEQFAMLEVNQAYLCNGYYGEKKVFGTPTMMPIFTTITKI